MTTVNDVLSLNLLGLVNTLSCLIACDIQRDVTDILILPTPRLDLNLDAGAGRAYVNDYECSTANKSLSVPTRTAAAEARRAGACAANREHCRVLHWRRLSRAHFRPATPSSNLAKHVDRRRRGLRRGGAPAVSG